MYAEDDRNIVTGLAKVRRKYGELKIPEDEGIP